MRPAFLILLALVARVNSQSYWPPGSLPNISLSNPCWEADPPCEPLACPEEVAKECATTARCDLNVVPETGCHCPEGLIGNGCSPGLACTTAGPHGCTSDGWTARVTFNVTGKGLVPDYLGNILSDGKPLSIRKKREWAAYLFGQSFNDFYTISSIHHRLESINKGTPATPVIEEYLTINMLFPAIDGAIAARDVFNDAAEANYDANVGPHVYGGSLVWGANVYRWKAQTTEAPTSIQATGMDVDFVRFVPKCAETGCWAIDVTYTAGSATGNFNTFYLPKVQDETDEVVWQEDLSYDKNWEDDVMVWNSFLPSKFPCGSNIDKSFWGYGTSPDATDLHITTCCINKFVQNYRAIKSFQDYFSSPNNACPTDNQPRIVERPGWSGWDIEFPANSPFLEGPFSGMDHAWAVYGAPMDPYIGQHTATIYIDEVELRRKAGLLKGTVGVEYTVDTFLGYANFRPTGQVVLDSAAMQVNIHLEKTSFFSVSTEGTNAYTFLEYVNMRLVTVYKEDVEFVEKFDDFETRFSQTSSEGSADYVQVTFTMGSNYSPNVIGAPYDGGLIPLNSVRAGKGTFFQDAQMEHKCVNYLKDAGNFWLPVVTGLPATTPIVTTEIRRDLSELRREGAKSSRKQPEGADASRRLLQDLGDDGIVGSQDEADSANVTWGPLDSCHEQARCFFLEWSSFNASDAKCGGDCEWEVCFVFNADHDPGCQVYKKCEKVVTNPRCDVITFGAPPQVHFPSDPDWNTTVCAAECDFEAMKDSATPPSSLSIVGSSVVSCSAVVVNPCGTNEGPGDFNPEFHFGNLFMWCDETADDCPADTDYPHDDVGYFNATPRTNITIGSRMCQRGKPGQKLFFVTQDGPACNLIIDEVPYLLHPSIRKQWQNSDVVAGLKREDTVVWPDAGSLDSQQNAQVSCQPRSEVNDDCPCCTDNPLGFDTCYLPDGNADGRNPCGCSQYSEFSPGRFAFNGFDTCTGTPDSNGVPDNFDLDRVQDSDSLALNVECVWTVQLPDFCGECECGYSFETEKCIPCRPNPRCPADTDVPPSSPAGDPDDEAEEDRCCGPFKARLCQDCAPGANMCVSPLSTPDSFVSYNIPLGVDWYPEPSSELDQNVFVHMVINALDSEGCADPNDGCEPLQVKTTLFGSIPVVEGGLNIFCSGVRAKTDLKDVANADIVVGTAATMDELSRLRILQNIANTNLQPFQETTTINSDSIEAGFLTFVVKGNASYFGLSGTTQYGMELEDLVTIHIMEPDTGTAFSSVQTLLAQAPDDNILNTTSPQGLDTDGYGLNGAFRFEVDRAEQRAFLEPTDALLDLCPFNPALPTMDVPFPTTCITRRDIRFRGFPARVGAYSTAMEVVPLENVAAGTCATDPADATLCDSGCTVDQNAKFMQLVLGSSDYADTLGRQFSCVIAKKYGLNGRYVRAWWINPAYEWSPVQTGGQEIFTVSQKIFLFALINLNENFQTLSAPTPPALSLPPSRRRRMLLSNTDGTGAGIGSQVVEFDVSPAKMMASAFDVPVDKVGTWKVTLALSPQQACLEPLELQKQIRSLLIGYALDEKTVSSFEQLLITSMQIDQDGLDCAAVAARRGLARRLLNQPSATVEMMIVFSAGVNAQIDLETFSNLAGIMSVTEVEVSAKIDQEASAIADRDLGGPSVGAGQDDEDEGGSGSSNLALIVGCAAGGVVAVLAGAALLWHFNKPTAEAEVASALPDLAALKSQLGDEV